MRLARVATTFFTQVIRKPPPHTRNPNFPLSLAARPQSRKLRGQRTLKPVGTLRRPMSFANLHGVSQKRASPPRTLSQWPPWRGSCPTFVFSLPGEPDWPVASEAPTTPRRFSQGPPAVGSTRRGRPPPLADPSPKPAKSPKAPRRRPPRFPWSPPWHARRGAPRFKYARLKTAPRHYVQHGFAPSSSSDSLHLTFLQLQVTAQH
mmetsp:Transcript_5744/g.14034  ORF Transcript_5744/g.14034 Transcript_5744/m.14034 type:complete len:205 (-) Transcript_5744:7-621(-)